MRFQEVTQERTLLVELGYDESLASELLSLAEAADLGTAWLLGTGAVREAELAIYDQDELVPIGVTVDEPLAMPVFTGTITTTGETRNVRIHGVLARQSGQALAGRIEAATVFGGEAVVWGFAESFDRTPDDATGMARLSL